MKRIDDWAWGALIAVIVLAALTMLLVSGLL
jgi:hypothetical protein